MAASNKLAWQAFAIATAATLALYWWLPVLWWWIYAVVWLVIAGQGYSQFLTDEAHKRQVDQPQPTTVRVATAATVALDAPKPRRERRPKDCGLPHPQPSCFCIACDYAGGTR